MSSFAALSLLPSLVASLTEQDLKRPTEIQQQAIPPLLAGKLVVGVAETGSGKTLAYVLPMLQRLKALETEGNAITSAGRPRGLVLVPGRELGEQVARVFKGLTHGTRLRVRTVLGGTAKEIARQSVAGKFEILVATPGRLVQLLDAGSVSINDMRFLVFDEADQMVDRSFLPVARRVVGDCPTGLQLAMFSATMPQALEVVVRDLFGEAPLRIRTKGSQRVVPTLTTDNRVVRDGRRFDVLGAVFDEHSPRGTLLFVNTREQCDTVSRWLTAEGITHATYRGQMDRKERRVNLARFRDGEVSVLLATDRGVELPFHGLHVDVSLPPQLLDLGVELSLGEPLAAGQLLNRLHRRLRITPSLLLHLLDLVLEGADVLLHRVVGCPLRLVKLGDKRGSLLLRFLAGVGHGVFDPFERAVLRLSFANLHEPVIPGQRVEHVEHEFDVVEVEPKDLVGPGAQPEDPAVEQVDVRHDHRSHGPGCLALRVCGLLLFARLACCRLR